MRLPAYWLLLPLAHVALSAEPAQGSDVKKRLVPKVRVANDEEFFAAWDMDYPGMEAVKAAARRGDLAAAKAALKQYFLARRKPKWRLNHWDMPTQPRGEAKNHSKYQQGQDVLAHRFAGYQFGDQIDWNCYPKKKPDGTPDTEYSPSPVSFRHASNVLGQLYWYSLDERYAQEFVAEVTDFVTRYPAPEKHRSYGPCMWSKLRSVGPLCGTWFDCYNYFLPSEHFRPEAHAIMLRGFIEKARYALRNPDRVNRYFAQLRGIYAVGCYFPELKQAEGFREFAASAMRAAIDAEFYPDTASKELCPGYQGMYLMALYGILENSKVMGRDAPPGLIEPFERCAEFYLRILTPQHTLPRFGDTGPSTRLPKTFRLNVVPLVDRPDFRWVAAKGAEGRPPAYTSTRLPWAGFYAMRSGWDAQALYLCFDAGPLGKGHFNEDANNFECYAYGERLIVDPGTYSYTFTEWRQYFVSSLAHNVVLVDGLGQNRAGSPRTPGRVTANTPRENDWHSDAVFDLVWGLYDARWVDYKDSGHWFNHYGKDKSVDLATHRRDLCFVKDSYWIVSDRLAAAGEHAYSQLFHFEPDRTVAVMGERVAGTTDASRANVVLIQADPVPTQLITGREDPIQGWVPLGGFKKTPAPVLSFDQTAQDGAHYDTVVYPLEPGHQAAVRVARLPVSDEAGRALPPRQVCALRIESPAGVDYYLNDLSQKEIGPANGRAKTAGPLRTNGRAAVVRLDAAGALRGASAVGATFVEMDGRRVWPQ